MCNWSKILVLLFLCCAGHSTSLGQHTWHESAQAVIAFDTTRLHEYKSDPDYQYARRTPETSWLGQVWRRVLRFFEDLFSTGAGLGQRILIFLLMGVAIAILLYFLLRSGFQGLFIRSDKRLGPRLNILDTDVHASTLASHIQTALAEGDYRLAYRWTYIELLHKLGEAGVIRLHVNKTNRDYLSEMHKSPFSQEFSQLAKAFDFVWYGEYPLDQRTFDEYSSLRDAILKQPLS